MTSTRQAVYARWLWLLLGLFCFRVLAQFVQLHLSLGFLPAFHEWQGSSLRYDVLLASQLVIIVVLAVTAWRFSTVRISPRPALGMTLLAVGGVYFAVMLVRLVLGFTVLAHSSWFASHLPAFFHLVLAGFILLVGRFHRYGRQQDGE